MPRAGLYWRGSLRRACLQTSRERGPGRTRRGAAARRLAALWGTQPHALAARWGRRGDGGSDHRHRHRRDSYMRLGKRSPGYADFPDWTVRSRRPNYYFGDSRVCPARAQGGRDPCGVSHSRADLTHSCANYQMVQPPSTRRSTPVMKLAASLNKKTAGPTISSGLALRPIGVSLA